MLFDVRIEKLEDKWLWCMMLFMQNIIDVPDEIIESLDRSSGAEKRSRAALIREAISDLLDYNP